MRSEKKTRTGYTVDVGRQRGELYRLAYKRARRARNAGFYIEAIAITESLIADRLESGLAILHGTAPQQRTAGQAAKALRAAGFPDEELLDLVSAWGQRRARAIHELAKINDSDGPTAWRRRLAEARGTADEGLDLLGRVTAASKALRRRRRVAAGGPADPAR